MGIRGKKFWLIFLPLLTITSIMFTTIEKAGIFADPPGDGASEEEMAEYAIRQEIKSAEFYSLFERSFPHAWKNAKMRVLVIEELEHEIKLRAAYPRVSV